MRYVLDSTALFNAKDFPADFEIVVPQGVIDELNRHELSERVSLLLGTRISLFSPSEESRKKVESASNETGDIDRLSSTDIDVISLALELGTPIISDDYSIQNVSEILGIQCIPMEESGIKKIYFWKYRCRGCGKEYSRKQQQCDVCGQELKSFRHKSREK